MRNHAWWGRARGAAPSEPYHRMLDQGDAMRRTACKGDPGDGAFRSASHWPEDVKRCETCLETAQLRTVMIWPAAPSIA